MTDALRQEIADLLNVEPQELTPDRALRDFEAWDSVTVLSLMVVLSESLGREISPAEVIQLATIDDIERLVSG